MEVMGEFPEPVGSNVHDDELSSHPAVHGSGDGPLNVPEALTVNAYNAFELLYVLRQMSDEGDERGLSAYARALGEGGNSRVNLVLRMWVEAACGDRTAFVESQAIKATNAKLDVKLFEINLAAGFDSGVLSDLLRFHMEHASDLLALDRSFLQFADGLRATVFPSGSTNPADEIVADDAFWKASWGMGAWEILKNEVGLSEMELGELIRALDALSSFSRYDHLSGLARVPVLSPETLGFVMTIPEVYRELRFREALDWAATGNWQLGRLTAEKIVTDPVSETVDREAASLLIRYCQLQVGDTANYGINTPAGEPGKQSRNSFEALQYVFEFLAGGGSNGANLVSVLPENPPEDSQGDIGNAVAALNLNLSDEGVRALVKLGDVTDALLAGSPFQRSLGIWLRAVQVQCLTVRGHYKYALRVSRYVRQLRERQPYMHSADLGLFDKGYGSLEKVVEGVWA